MSGIISMLIVASPTSTLMESRNEKSRKSYVDAERTYVQRETHAGTGQTVAGRCLQIFYVPDENPDNVFVITAYEPRDKAKKAFRRRQRRKPR